MNVSAKDVKTGKEQRIVIKASSGLSEAEIKRMVADAEAHAEEDKKFRELVGARNKADASGAHGREGARGRRRQGLRRREEVGCSEAIAAVKAAMASDDRDDIERKTQALEQASAAILQKMYEQSAGGAAQARLPVLGGRRRQECQEGRRARCGVRRGQGKRPQEGLSAPACSGMMV